MDDPLDTDAEPVDETLQLRAIFCLPGTGFDTVHDLYFLWEEKVSVQIGVA